MITHNKIMLVKIEIDEKRLKDRYPNFSINYSNGKEFMDALILNINEDKIKELGYNIKISKYR